jgi:uncharacterized protein
MQASQTRRTLFAAGFALTAATTVAAQPADRPVARNDLFAVLYRPGPAWRAGRPMQEQDLKAHVAYMQQLADQGVMLAAGPLTSLDGGLIVLTAASLDAATEIMRADPAVAGGVFQGEVSAWLPVFDPGGRYRAPA